MAKQDVVNVTSNQKATPAAENEFIYGGYHFTPYGLFSEKENSDFKYLTRKLRTDTELGFFTYDNIAGRTRKYRYNYFMRLPATVYLIFSNARKTGSCMFPVRLSCLVIQNLFENVYVLE